MILKIVKYRKGTKGKYKIELENCSSLNLYEEVILKYELLLKKEINDEELCVIEKANQEWDVYYVALTSIKYRFKSVYDTREFLKKKEYPDELIDKAIDKLVSQGYLNDRSFCKSYINNQIFTTNKGPNKIIRELQTKKISSSIIEEEIKSFDKETQLEKINKVATRLHKSNRNRGGAVLKKKIFNDLINLGYNSDLICSVLEKLDFSNDKDIAKKEYDKLYKRLSRKYSGNELEYKIKEKLYQKGLYYAD